MAFTIGRKCDFTHRASLGGLADTPADPKAPTQVELEAKPRLSPLIRVGIGGNWVEVDARSLWLAVAAVGMIERPKSK
jgi:hypothetical protein